MATQTTQMNVDGKLVKVTVTVSDTVTTSTNQEGRKKPLQPHFGPATLVYGW